MNQLQAMMLEAADALAELNNTMQAELAAETPDYFKVAELATEAAAVNARLDTIRQMKAAMQK